MSVKPITYFSLNLGPNVGTTDDFIVGVRVVPDGRSGNEVYGRALITGEPDNGEGILLNVGDKLVHPEGSLRVTLEDVDRYAQVQPDGYASITNTVWAWLQIPPYQSEAFSHYMLAAARRLDQAHALCVQALQELDSLPEEQGIPRRTRAFNALANSESMCLALSRAIRMIRNAADKFNVTTPAHPDLLSLEEPATAIRDAFEHIDERALGIARRETSTDALSIFRQGDLVSGRVLRYAGHSLSLPSDVLPNLVKARQFLHDAISERGNTKTINQRIEYGPVTEDWGIFDPDTGDGKYDIWNQVDHDGRPVLSSRTITGGNMGIEPTAGEKTPLTIAYCVNRKIHDNLAIPLRQGPIRFAVMNSEGTSSNSWRIWTERDGSAYVKCRDNMKELKVSLHSSGAQQVAFTTESGVAPMQGGRFCNQWEEPPNYDGTPMVPTLSLFFPNWALALGQTSRQKYPRYWDNNDLCLEAPAPPLATIVSFYILDEGLRIHSVNLGNHASCPLAILPLRPGKKLLVVAQYQHESNMLELAQFALNQMNADADWVEKLKEFPSGHVFGACISGNVTAGGVYLLPFAPTLHRLDRPAAPEAANHALGLGPDARGR